MDTKTEIRNMLSDRSFFLGVIYVALVTSGLAAPPVEIDRTTSYRVELTQASPIGEASIREHAICWHPIKNKYYLVADVVPLNSPHYPNTYETELHLWSSRELLNWTYHGIVVEKGNAENSYHRHGVASPAGLAFFKGQLYVPFSARKTSKFTQRGIGLAVSNADPEQLPWTKTTHPVSDLVGEDDDPALLVLPDEKIMHLYHRNAGPQGYQIVHTHSKEPHQINSWSKAQQVAPSSEEVRAQELTGLFYADNQIHLFIIEHLVAGGTRIAFLQSENPAGPFEPVQPNQRFLQPGDQGTGLAYSGHITPVMRDQKLIAFFWTVHQSGKRYGLLGHPARLLPGK